MPHGSSRLPHGLFSKSAFKKANVLPFFNFKTAKVTNILKGFTGFMLKIPNLYAGSSRAHGSSTPVPFPPNPGS
jgi:hypothetical protein